MKARVEKKLSKRLKEIAPSQFDEMWLDWLEPSELAYSQNTRVRHVWSVGGGNEIRTVWEEWKNNWCWQGPFEAYPAGHKLEGFPNIDGFRATTINLLKLAAECERLGTKNSLERPRALAGALNR
ncbi:hypothetical protein [Pseudomonas asiatica]|uniref:hypothetical protein n=1 Tax=Pseudomonas asiatica TaxID=2219225 RepID=UPI0010C15458|nr:hypothetical protein [Pseudomonas asiatica]EKT4528324.1 hypothetical protein [Pseudomonas putida]